ncbi:hypothetical protein H310_05014 [Aphanomyces invadans]|uniref:protein-histidine N-methyltransferase n=1 Tax=Aphanomyces invadans TaxID=157072 RepID=A0A024UBN3_9STRA|nr:hypothetical protein H310_05014 [Aphanomyces invadans]ETW03610.1 hypothetical protein H310_05014 [Aphanomyces invadans]|eukprot:XP_008867839.1 hypothetical protein H310_05014 [Aphanomyces invadans]
MTDPVATTLRELTAALGRCTSWKDLLDMTVLNKIVTLAATLRGLERSNSLVADDVVHKATLPATVEDFQSWLKRGMQVQFGEETFNVESMGEYGNGLRARMDLPKGSRILSIPLNLLLTSSSLPPPLAHLRQDPLCRQFPTIPLALHILYEALSPSSFFAPYIAVLPRTFHLPIEYTVADFAALSHSKAAYESAIQLFYNSIRQYLYLCRLFSHEPSSAPYSSDAFSLSNYTWALSVALTRQNNVPTPADPSALALIPGWDMCNHAIGEMTTYADTDAIHCSAMNKFAAGDEIYICYGPRPNVDLLIYSGFSLPQNPYNCPLPLVLPLKDIQHDPLAKLRTLLLQKRSATITAAGLLVHLDATSGQLASSLYREQVQLLVLDKPSLAIALRRVVDKATTAATGRDDDGDPLVPWPDQAAMRNANALVRDACAAVVANYNAVDASAVHQSILSFLATERQVYEQVATGQVVEFRS